MSDWTVTFRRPHQSTDLTIGVLTFGLHRIDDDDRTWLYTIEHRDTGQRKQVVAGREYAVGEIIDESDFAEIEPPPVQGELPQSDRSSR